MIQKFRPLNQKEKEILEFLLQEKFPGRDELAKQTKNLLAKEIDPEGSLEFQVAAGPLAKTAERIPVEAIMKDADGVPICILLHVVNGHLSELEFYKADGTPFKDPVEVHKLQRIIN